jgi:hypothetical protein
MKIQVFCLNKHCLVQCTPLIYFQISEHFDFDSFSSVLFPFMKEYIFGGPYIAIPANPILSFRFSLPLNKFLKIYHFFFL